MRAIPLIAIAALALSIRPDHSSFASPTPAVPVVAEVEQRPYITFVRFGTEAADDGHTSRYALLRMTNPTDHPVYWYGHDAPDGPRAYPHYQTTILRDGAWTRFRRFFCGTGADWLRIIPGGARTFRFYQEPDWLASDAVQASLSFYPAPSPDNAVTVWSDAIPLPPPATTAPPSAR